jgi:predicted transcriptional regulator
MTKIHQNILAALTQANALTTTEIAKAVNAHRDHVQEALHDLDDEGKVIMRNGFYRASEAARAESK